MTVENGFNEIFDIEIEGWCFGITQYPGEIFPGLIHNVIKEMAPSFKAAVEHLYEFDILNAALQISKACKYIVHEKEIAFSILVQLPHPSTVTEEGKSILTRIVNQVEQEHGGAVVRMEKRWATQLRGAA